MKKAIVLGTGPSLARQRDRILELHSRDEIDIFGVNRTWSDFPLHSWIACDIKFNHVYGPPPGDFEKYHWDQSLCHAFGYRWIRGKWSPGLSLDPQCIHYGHSSTYQALGIAALGGYQEIYLAGFDMAYIPAAARHYFIDLSNEPGEYPPELRKYSPFEKPKAETGHCKSWSLFQYYDSILEQSLPFKIYNMTEASAYRGFEFKQP